MPIHGDTFPDRKLGLGRISIDMGGGDMKRRVYVGTYTGGNQSDSPLTGSKGIYAFSLQEDGKGLSFTGCYSNNDIDPGFLVYRNGYLFVENERKDRAVLHSYRVEEDGSLIFVNAVETTGSKCAHVCADAFGSYVFGANYASGSVLVTRSDENGQLTMTDLVQHYGHSIVPVRQDAPRAHAVIQTPDGTGVIVPDLGTDKLVNYKLDRKSGKLVRNPNQPVVQVASGEGPRHFVFHPCGRYGYLLTEIGNHIYVYNYDGNQGILTEKQCVSTLPEKFSGTSYAAELIVSKDGRFLYACNRGHDSIAAFSIDETGKLHAPDFWPCGGKGPRHICFGPEEHTIFVANKESNQISIMERNEQTGAIGNVLATADVPAPACVVMI